MCCNIDIRISIVVIIMADLRERLDSRPNARTVREHESVPQPQRNGVTVNVYASPGSACSLKKMLVGACIFLLLSSVVVNTARLRVNDVLCQWIGWSPLGQCWVAEEDVRKFSHLFNIMTSNSFGEIEDLPAIIEAARHNIEGKMDTFVSSGIAEGGWQENFIDKAFEVLRLYRDAKESVFEFVLRGRSLMRDMVNRNVDEMQRAFDRGEYEIIHMQLGDIRDHLKEADKALEDAKVKLKNAVSTTDDLFRLITTKLAEKVTSAENVQGWSAGYTTTLYTLGIAFGAAVTVLTPVPLAVGAAAGAGFTGFYQFMDAVETQKLRHNLDSEARELSTAGGKVRHVRDILNQCIFGVTELKLAVDEARLSTEKMTGYLRPGDAELFRICLHDAKRKYRNLLTLYEQTVESIQSGSIKPKRLT